MDMSEFLKRVDAQIREKLVRLEKPSERRQQKIAVSEERRSGQDRRGVRRALAALVDAMPDGCGGDCQQGRLPCNCNK